MNIMLRLFVYCISCFMTAPLCATYQFAEPRQEAALVAFAQDPIAQQHTVNRGIKQSRRVHFVNNIQRIATGTLKSYNSLSLIDPICTINDINLQADEERELDIENDRCLVNIRLRPGIAQTVSKLEGSWWGRVVRFIEQHLLRTRSLTFVCYLPDCDTVDTATLLFNACAQSESEDFNIRMRSPVDLEISLPSPVEY